MNLIESIKKLSIKLLCPNYEKIQNDRITLLQDNTRLNNDLIELKKNLNDLNTLMDMLSDENNKLLEANNQLEFIEKTYTKPSFLSNTEGYRGMRNYVKQNGDVIPVQIWNQDVYTVTPTLVEWVKTKQKQKSEWTRLEKCKEIQKYVSSRGTYGNELGEDWQDPSFSVRTPYKDCDTGTILFVAMCRTWGIPPTDVFNCVGDCHDKINGKVLHSNPNQKINDEWWVFETTKPVAPDEVKLLKSNYYSANRGLSNWIWNNKLKTKYKIGQKYQL